MAKSVSALRVRGASPGSSPLTAASMAAHVVPSSRAAAARRTSIVLSPMPARRHVDDPLEADAVGVGSQDAQVGQGVLDLAPGVEPRPADELVADPVAQERFLDRPGLGVHPVHDRDLAGPEALVGVVVVRPPGQRAPAPADHALDLAGDPLGLLFLVVRLEALDQDPARVVRPQLLVLARRVARDDRVGGVEDELGRAVVLLELDHGGVRPVALEVEDVAQVGATPRVDRLVVVADHAQVAVAGGEGADPQVLRAVGVLVFVDVEVAPASPGTWPGRRAPPRTAARPRAAGRRSRARSPCAGAPGSGSRAGRSSARGGSRRSRRGTSGRASRSWPG